MLNTLVLIIMQNIMFLKYIFAKERISKYRGWVVYYNF